MTALVSLLSESPSRTPGFQKLSFIRRRIAEGVAAKESQESLHQILGSIASLSIMADRLPLIMAMEPSEPEGGET